MLRQKRNQHAPLIKQILLIEQQKQREKKLEEHAAVGKDYKKDIAQREAELDEVEKQLVKEALRLPNKTHPDSPVGGENEN